MKCRSLWHSPAKAVRSKTSRGPGLVSPTSSIVKGWFAVCRTAAFIGGLLLEGSPISSFPRKRESRAGRLRRWPLGPRFRGATESLRGRAGRWSLLKIEAQAGLGPIHRSQLASTRESYVGGLHIPTAKADIGRVDIGHLDLAHDLAVGSDDRDVAGDQGRDGDIARGLDREAVKALEAGQSANEATGVGRRELLLAKHPGLDDVEGEEPRALGIRDIDGLLIR